MAPKRVTFGYEARRPPDAARGWEMVLCLFLAAFFSLVFCIYTIGRVKDTIVISYNKNLSPRILDLLRSLGPIDALLAGLSVAALAVIIYWEWRARAFSNFLSLATRWQGLAVLTIIVAWLGQAYLFPGVLLGGDTGAHIARFLEVREGLVAGVLPQWTNFDYLGSPLLGFTGPLLYVIGGALDTLIRDPVITAKVLLFATHLGAAWAFYALLVRFGIGRMSGVLAAVGFSGSFAALHLFLFRGVFPQAFTIIGLILVFYAAEGLMRSARAIWHDWLVFALSVGGLIINHQPHALFVGLYLGLFGGMSLILGRWRWSRLWTLVTAGTVGIGISLVAVIPIVVESDWVMIDPGGGGLLRLHLPTWPRLLELLIWHNTRVPGGTDYWDYLGFVLIVLAIAGCLSAWRSRLGAEHRRLALAVLPGLALSFFLYNPVVRDVIFMLFFVGILAALGLELLGRAGSRMTLAIAVALILDVASTSVQPVARRDKGFLIDAGRYLARVAPDERIAEIGLMRDGSFSVDIGPGAGPLSAYAMVQRVAGAHNMAATRIHNFAVTILETAADDLRRDGRVSASTLRLLGLLNVTRIICFSPTAAGCPESFAQASTDGPLGRVIRIPGASPVMFSRSLVKLTPPTGLEKPMLWAEAFTKASPTTRDSRIARIDDFLKTYLHEAGISSESHLALALPVRGIPTGESAVADGDTWHPVLAQYNVSLETVKMQIIADGDGYVQLSHPWYPGNEVSINGRRITPLQGALGFLVLPTQAGVNNIEIRPATTPVRYYSAMASLSMLIIACLSATLLALRRPREQELA
jgi:hypothetical protein